MKYLIIFLLVFINSKLLFSVSDIDYLNSILNIQDTISSGSTPVTLYDDIAYNELYKAIAYQIRLLDKQIGNVSGAASYYKCEGSIIDNLIVIWQSIRDLLVKKNNGTLAEDERQAIDTEIYQYLDEIIYTLKNSQYNGIYYYKDLFSRINLADYYDRVFESLNDVDLILKYFIAERSRIGVKILHFERMEKEFDSQKSNLPEQMNIIKKDYMLFLINIFNMKK